MPYQRQLVFSAQRHVKKMALYYMRGSALRHRRGGYKLAYRVALRQFRRGYRKFYRGRWLR